MTNDEIDIKIHYRSTERVSLTAWVAVNDTVIKQYHFTTQMQGNINLTCNLPKNVNVSFGLTCKDFRIYKFPVTVTCIELDNFYKLKTYSFKGTNQYDQEFLKFVKINRLQIDHQSNSNCLFFTGKLIYNITSPISGMIFGDFRHYKEIQ